MKDPQHYHNRNSRYIILSLPLHFGSLQKHGGKSFASVYTYKHRETDSFESDFRRIP